MSKDKTNNKGNNGNNGQQGNGCVSEMEARRSLVLLCLYLSGWEEESKKNPGENIKKSWKGYRFEDLNELSAQKLIIQKAPFKTALVTEEGQELARGLKNELYQMLNVKVDG